MKLFTRMTAIVLMVLAMMSPAFVAAQEASPVATPIVASGSEGAVAWLIQQQQDDGSWLGFSGEPDAGTTIDAIIALSAADEAGIDTGDSIDTALAWLGTDDVAAIYAEGGVGQAAKLVLALVAADAESLEIGGIDPLAMVVAGQDEETGLYGLGIYHHSYSLMALAVTGSDVPESAITYLESVQAENGGYAWDGSLDEAMVDSNTTAMVVQALVAVGEGDSPVVAGAIDYLKLTVNDQGAAYSIGAESDANSTALVAQALIAVGDDPIHLVTSLESFQNASGAYHWMHSDPTDNPFTTIQVIPATVGIELPVVPGMLEDAIAA